MVQDAVRLADPFTFLLLRFTLGAAVLTVRGLAGLADRRFLRRGPGSGRCSSWASSPRRPGSSSRRRHGADFSPGSRVLLVPVRRPGALPEVAEPAGAARRRAGGRGLMAPDRRNLRERRRDGEGRSPDHRLRDRLRLLHRAARAGGPGAPLDAAGGGAAVGRGVPGAGGAAVRAAPLEPSPALWWAVLYTALAQHGRLPARSDLGAGPDLGGARGAHLRARAGVRGALVGGRGAGEARRRGSSGRERSSSSASWRPSSAGCSGRGAGRLSAARGKVALATGPTGR